MALALGACGSDGAADDTTRAMVLETCAPSAEPVEVQICECAYEAISERYDADELARLDQQLRDDPDTVPADVQEAVLSCSFDVVAPPTTKPDDPTTTTRRGAGDEP